MIIPMKRLTLAAHKDDEAAILKAIQRINAVEIIQSGAEQADDGSSLAELEEKVELTKEAVRTLKPYAPKAGLLTPLPEATPDDLFKSLPKGLEESLRVRELLRSITDVTSAIEKNDSLLETLAPWHDFDGDMQTFGGSDRVRFFTGMISQQDLEKLDSYRDILEYQVFGRGQACAVLIACPAEEAKKVQQCLKSLQWTDVAFPRLSGTPAEAEDTLRHDNEELSARKEKLQEELRSLASETDEIARAGDAAVFERDRAKASMEMGRTESTFLLEGWIRADEEEKVRSTILSVTRDCYLDIRDPNEDETPPSVVRNTEFAEPFEAVTNLYSRPDPSGIDGTPFMAPFYVLLFGMMLSDTGYGLILAIGCYLFLRLKKPSGMIGSLAHVIFWGGLSTIIWGVLIGTFFGMDFDTLFGTKDVFPLVVDPMDNPITMLILCFGLGVVHLLAGVFIHIRMCFAAGDWRSAIYDNLSWVLIVVGLIAFAGTTVAAPGIASLRYAGIGMIAIGVLMILLFKGRSKKNVLLRTVSGLGELYQVTSWLSDVLSYSRLFALGIATGVIASVFNDICSMLMAFDNPILKVLGILVACALLAGLHLFNIFINTLGAFVHCARLQYVEFYGKFYEPGGKEFRPLGMKSSNVRLT